MRKLFFKQDGAMNLVGILLMGIGMVFLAVGFIMFPIVTTATDALLDYEYATNTAITDSSYTGFTAIIGITPLLVLIGYVTAAVFSMYLGVRVVKGGAGSTKLDLGSLLLLGLSMVFIAIALIIMPVTLDGISSVYHGGGTGISSSYTGLSSILLMVPMLVLVSFIAAAVLSGYFGFKKIASGSPA